MMLLSGMETARAENLRPVGARLLADGRCRLGLGVVHEVFQLLAGLEEGNFLGGDFDLCSSFRIAPNSSTARKFPSSSPARDRKSTRLNSSHVAISYAVFCLKKKKQHKV